MVMTREFVKNCFVAALAAALFSPVSHAALLDYSEDFEGLNAADGGALGGAGWKVFGAVFTGGGDFKFGFGPFAAPNGGPSFSAIASGEGGPAQGSQYLNAYSDYNCCGNPDQGHRNGTDVVEAIVFQEFTIDGIVDATTWIFSFDVKNPSIDGCNAPNDGTAQARCVAFIKTLDPSAGFSVTNLIEFDASNASSDEWARQSLMIDINEALAGQLLQIGFSSTASNFQNTGVFYDNLTFTVIPVPGAAWLFGSALLWLGWRSRHAARGAADA